MKSCARIAVIDDNRAWRETLAGYLGSKGFLVFAAADARHGLDLLETKDIRTALIDFHMGEMSGLELLHVLRQIDLPVAAFLMSSDEDPTLPARALAEGARAFLSKTLAPAQFLRTLLQKLHAQEAYFPLVIQRAIQLPVPVSSRDPRRN